MNDERRVKLIRVIGDIPEGTTGFASHLFDDFWLCEFRDSSGGRQMIRVMERNLEFITEDHPTRELWAG